MTINNNKEKIKIIIIPGLQSVLYPNTLHRRRLVENV
jgi:hypothetical protein